LPELKHVVKCRACGHVFDVLVCDLQGAGKVLQELITTMGVWSMTGRKCPKCGATVSLGPRPNAHEIAISRLTTISPGERIVLGAARAPLHNGLPGPSE
jgi:uncharacterized Zn finger protein